MRTITSLGVVVTCVFLAAATAQEPAGAFQGEWRTTIGLVTLEQKGEAVTGTYGAGGQFPLKGTLKGNLLTFAYEEGNIKGDGRFMLDAADNAFTGNFQIPGGQSGNWNGWRPDPKATAGPATDYAGAWLTDLGLMELTQDKVQVAGRYALRGTSKIEGKVTGRRLDLEFEGFLKGRGWFDLAGDSQSKAFTGAGNTNGYAGWFGWTGRPAPEFQRHAALVPGKIIDGSTKNLLTYTVRAPDTYQSSSTYRWPTILILHGSNMNSRSYVGTIATVWPDLARDFILLGLNGETPSNTSAEPRFNFTYANYMGRKYAQRVPGYRPRKPCSCQRGDG
jgi:hypothetical protein